MEYYELYHHGIKGQKWGVRRYQNADGTLTAEGKRHKSSMTPEQKKNIAKKVAIGAASIGATAAAAYYISKHPEAIKSVVEKAKSVKVKDLAASTVSKGKDFVKTSAKNAVKGVKEGVKEGIKEAPKKAAKAVVTGVVLNTAKRALDKAVGSEESTRIFQANDPKKIGKFWKVQKNDED